MEEKIQVQGVSVNLWRKGPPTSEAGKPVGEKGEGEPLFLLTGWNGTFELNEEFLEALVKQGFAVYSIEFPGSGKSDAPPPDWTFDNFIELVDAVFVHCKLVDAYVIGHSFGGVTALRFARYFPHRVRKLVIVNAPVLSSKFPFIRRGKVPLWLFDGGFFLFTVLLKPAQWILKPFKLIAKLLRLHKIWQALHHANIDFMVWWLEDQYRFLTRSKGIIRKIKRALIKIDTAEDARNVHVPTLLLWGERGGITPTSNIKVYQKNMKHAEIHIIPEGPHHPGGPWAEKYAAIIADWINES